MLPVVWIYYPLRYILRTPHCIFSILKNRVEKKKKLQQNKLYYKRCLYIKYTIIYTTIQQNIPNTF